MKCLKLLAAAAFLLASLPASAQLYVFGGAGLGNPKFDGNDWPFNSGVSRRNDTKDSTYQAGIGYRFSPIWAVEFGAADLGDYSIDLSDAFGSAIRGTYEISGVKTAVVASWPLTERFSVYGKLGISSTKVEYEGSHAVLGTPVPIRADERRNSLLAGFGAQYMIWQHLGVRAEFENWGEVGNERLSLDDSRHTGRAKMGTWNLQAVFSF
jgi:OOP family OmpA-OmpF porin